MNKWQLARYLIDAKKCIDSLLYINNKFKKVINLDLREIIDSKLRKFYINLCIIIDHSYKREDILEMKKNDNIIRKKYYERDKNYAHKDKNYQKEEILKLNNLINRLKKELDYCYIKCKNNLPEGISIDYVSYDNNLFRFVNQISPQLEERVYEVLYKKENINDGKIFKVFEDTEEINKVKDSKKYAVFLKNGLILKEGLQNRQDFCIKVNVLHKENVWFPIQNNYNKIIEQEEKAFLELLKEIRNSSFE